MFNDDVERVATRNGFGEGLVNAADSNEQVVGLCCDLTESTRMHHFAEKYPDRFIEIGVAEQNLASVGSGSNMLFFLLFGYLFRFYFLNFC